MRNLGICAYLFLLLSVACSTRDELTIESTATASQPVTSTPIPEIVKGYRHDPSVSRFKLGPGIYSESTAIGSRYVGSKGAILITTTGATIAVPNADSGVEAAGPLSTDPAVHTAAVLAYFGAAGLPPAQIAGTRISTFMAATGSTSDQVAPIPKLVGYSTVIDRQVGGVRISGSYAWARLNANGDVMAEEVYWPDLPAAVVSEAAQMQMAMGTAANKSALMAKLPARWALAENQVVIRHSPHYQVTFEAYAAVEVRTQSQPGPAWYDLNGQQLLLISDKPQANTATRGNTSSGGGG
jgi:hypothetical protein